MLCVGESQHGNCFDRSCPYKHRTGRAGKPMPEALASREAFLNEGPQTTSNAPHHIATSNSLQNTATSSEVEQKEENVSKPLNPLALAHAGQSVPLAELRVPSNKTEQLPNALPSKKVNQLNFRPPYKTLTWATAPDPRLNATADEKEMLRNFTSPARDPVKVHDLDTRQMLETAFTILEYPKIEFKRWLVLALTFPYSLASFFEIVKGLFEMELEDDEKYTMITFRTRCIPIMKIFGHQYMHVDNLTQGSLKWTINTIFPTKEYVLFFIVRTIGAYIDYIGRPDLDETVMRDVFEVMLNFLLSMGKVSEHIQAVATELVATYWMISFVETVQDSWYGGGGSKIAVYGKIRTLANIYNLQRYFPPSQYHQNNLDKVRRVVCPTLLETGDCIENDSGNCFMRHELGVSAQSYVNTEDKEYKGMQLWANSAYQRSVFTEAEQSKFWERGLSIFDAGNEAFVIDVLCEHEGLLHIGEVTQANPSNSSPERLATVNSFLGIFSDPRFEIVGKSRQNFNGVVNFIVDCGNLYQYSHKTVKLNISRNPHHSLSLQVASRLIGFARLLLSFNPVQRIESKIRTPLIEFIRIIAQTDTHNATNTADVTTVTERLGFCIKKDLITGNVELVDKDTLPVEVDDFFSSPLEFTDNDPAQVTT
ncbi:hypothetical protein ABW19_dt0201826 [Dactylella cylindrospora]|nr:hypothetical protein ABW19_dt0201826 [Dactylella cylindrospora]